MQANKHLKIMRKFYFYIYYADYFTALYNLWPLPQATADLQFCNVHAGAAMRLH